MPPSENVPLPSVSHSVSGSGWGLNNMVPPKPTHSCSTWCSGRKSGGVSTLNNWLHLKKWKMRLDMVAHAFILVLGRQRQAQSLVSMRPAWSTHRAQGEPGPHREVLSQNKEPKGGEKKERKMSIYKGYWQIKRLFQGQFWQHFSFSVHANHRTNMQIKTIHSSPPRVHIIK